MIPKRGATALRNGATIPGNGDTIPSRRPRISKKQSEKVAVEVWSAGY